LIVVPGKLNYFYNLAGRRLGEALGAMGRDVEIRTLHDASPSDHDLVILSNVTEIVASVGGASEGVPRLRSLRAGCRELLSLGIDCVSTPWFDRLRDLSRAIRADRIVDLGLVAQTPTPRSKGEPPYEFLFSGLTPSEIRTTARLAADGSGRDIPWAFIGHVTESRAALVDRLVQDLHPGGFVYAPTLAPYVEHGSPHLNQEQFERVLRHARYQVWCSHHEHFYMEPERFRTSLLTGGVPIKIVTRKQVAPAGAPFGYLLIPIDDLRELSRLRFEEIVSRFRRDWENLPTLERGLRDLLGDAPDVETEARRVRAA
jgi:hypothetical protein